MGSTLFLANFPQDTTEEDIRAVFGKKAQIDSIEFTTDTYKDKTYTYALVTMASEKIATKAMHTTNGAQMGDLYLTISPSEAGLHKDLTSKQRRQLDEIIADLDEDHPKPLRMLEAMMILCGSSFMRVIHKETEEVENAGGLMRHDNAEERRTRGGVFFYLARNRVSRPIRSIIYSRQGRFPEIQPEEDEAENGTESEEAQNPNTDADASSSSEDVVDTQS